MHVIIVGHPVGDLFDDPLRTLVVLRLDGIRPGVTGDLWEGKFKSMLKMHGANSIHYGGINGSER